MLLKLAELEKESGIFMRGLRRVGNTLTQNGGPGVFLGHGRQYRAFLEGQLASGKIARGSAKGLDFYKRNAKYLYGGNPGARADFLAGANKLERGSEKFTKVVTDKHGINQSIVDYDQFVGNHKLYKTQKPRRPAGSVVGQQYIKMLKKHPKATMAGTAAAGVAGIDAFSDPSKNVYV